MGSSDADVAISAAEAGAAVVRARYGGPLTRYEKSAMDFATDADIDAERAILDVLRGQRPGDGYQGEELGESGDGSSPRTWLIDPLCGTLNFAAQTPLVAVNVALREGDTVSVAASADPLAGEIFWTDGQAAYRRHDGVDEPLAPSAATHLVDVNLHASLSTSDGSQAARMLVDEAFLAAFRPRVLSSTLALAWVAAGRRAAYVSGGNLRDSVHEAAALALCQAAGCVVTGIEGQPLHTGVGGLIAAADAQTHATLLSILGQPTAA